MQGVAYHPAFGQLVNYEALPLADDPDTQVAQTIDRMRANVRADRAGYPIAQQAAALGDDPCTAAFWLTKNKIQFARDEQTSAPIRPLLDDDVVEVLIRPRDLAQMAAPVEDCDGFASYLAALLTARGIPCSFVTVAADAREPAQYSHVYLAAYPAGRRLALDASHGPYPGWECPNLYGKKKEWPIDGPDWRELFTAAALLTVAGVAAKWAGWL